MKNHTNNMEGKTALFVIDMQNVFVKKDSPLEVKNIRNNLNEFKEFIEKLREKGILIIYTRHCFSIEGNPIEAKLFPKLKDEMKKGTKEWSICDKLKPNEGDIVIDKTRYDSFFKTELDDILKKNNIKNIIITGTITNICCESTARSAMYRDYNVIFCSNLNHCSVKELHENTLKVIRNFFGEVKTSKEILDEF